MVTLARVLISIGVLFYILLIPLLEWNQTHVFHPDWPPHARFHHVWQLITNVTLGILVLWLSWRRRALNIAAAISCCVMGGVILSYMLSGYTGSSIQSGNITEQVWGLDIAAWVALSVVAVSVFACFLNAYARKA